MGWKEKLDSLLKIVDDGLGLISGLGFVSNDSAEILVEKKGGKDGSKALFSCMQNGPVRGPMMRPVLQT